MNRIKALQTSTTTASAQPLEARDQRGEEGCLGYVLEVKIRTGVIHLLSSFFFLFLSLPYLILFAKVSTQIISEYESEVARLHQQVAAAEQHALALAEQKMRLGVFLFFFFILFYPFIYFLFIIIICFVLLSLLFTFYVESDMKKAFMRGMCALNIEASTILKVEEFSSQQDIFG